MKTVKTSTEKSLRLTHHIERFTWQTLGIMWVVKAVPSLSTVIVTDASLNTRGETTSGQLVFLITFKY